MDRNIPAGTEEGTPHPGSDVAVAAGCLCPVMDNGHGNEDIARDRGGWVMRPDCPVHFPPF